METVSVYRDPRASRTNDDVCRLGAILRVYREKLGMSQTQLAREIRIPQSMLSQVELHGILAVSEKQRDILMDWLLE